MASVIRQIMATEDLRVSVEYDDQTLQILNIIANNTGIIEHTVTATATSNGRSYSRVIPVQTEITQAIPQNLQNRLQVTIRPSGRLDGVEWNIF